MKHSIAILSSLIALSTAAVSTVVAAAPAQDLPKRPEQLAFRPLTFNAPKASDYRHVLSNGVVVFLAPS
ncbi:MAG: hypothetical protein NTU45_13300, partial [Planctomycetota bacterium]|nr:hypothetical protein [Planctomycetota bacterium]